VNGEADTSTLSFIRKTKSSFSFAKRHRHLYLTQKTTTNSKHLDSVTIYAAITSLANYMTPFPKISRMSLFRKITLAETSTGCRLRNLCLSCTASLFLCSVSIKLSLFIALKNFTAFRHYTV